MTPTAATESRPACAQPDLHTELVRFSHALHGMRATAGTGSDLTQAAVPYLSILAASGPMRSRDLASATFLDPSTVSRKVDSLVRAGYVRRVVDPQDGRASLLETTPEGLAAIQERRRRVGAVVADVTRDWPPAQLEEFIGLLTRFNDDAAGHLPALRGQSPLNFPQPAPDRDARAATTSKERNT